MIRKTAGFRSRENSGTTMSAGLRSRRGNYHRLKPGVLELEDRQLLSTIVVNNPTDSPVNNETDLRQAIDLANSSQGDNTITFSSVFNTPQTITLSGSQLEFNNKSGGTQTTTVIGPAGGLTIDANRQSRDFQIDGSSNVTMSSLTITGGTGDYGGALYVNGQLNLNNCTVVNNTSSYYGGGLYEIAGRVNLTDCTFTGNSTGGSYWGGGVYNQDSGVLAVVNCTFTNNTANYGGGIYNYGGNMTVQNSIIAANKASSGGPDIYNQDHLTSYGNNLIGNTSNTGNIWQPSDRTNVSDPRLAPLGNYGGPTQTFALLPGSQAIGNGTKTSYAGTSTPLTIDQRGLGLDSTPDIGAFQNVPLVVNTTTDYPSSPMGGVEPAPGGRTGQLAERGNVDQLLGHDFRDTADDHAEWNPARTERHDR